MKKYSSKLPRLTRAQVEACNALKHAHTHASILRLPKADETLMAESDGGAGQIEIVLTQEFDGIRHPVG